MWWPSTLMPLLRLGSSTSGGGLKPTTWKRILLRSDCRCGSIDTATNQLHMTLWMVCFSFCWFSYVMVILAGAKLNIEATTVIVGRENQSGKWLIPWALLYSRSWARHPRAEKAGHRAAPMGALPPWGEPCKRRTVGCRGPDLTASADDSDHLPNTVQSYICISYRKLGHCKHFCGFGFSALSQKWFIDSFPPCT